MVRSSKEVCIQKPTSYGMEEAEGISWHGTPIRQQKGHASKKPMLYSQPTHLLHTAQGSPLRLLTEMCVAWAGCGLMSLSI